MRQVIVAFERQSNCDRLREIVEKSGEFSCVVCRTADQVRRAVRKLRLDIVVCGFKLGEESCESLFYDLPQRCSMLMVAPQAQLDLCETEGIFKLQAPVRRSELMASVRLLAQVARSASSQVARGASSQGHSPARRSQEERELVERAKAVLMSRHGMTEEQAHRFLQKQSMDNGARLTDTAKLVLADQ
ncbi:MAG: ANTAR domain-containing protein [Clostridiales bacterium]|nr:ANTAR domain-containing protein [Clostridiales bacterium]